MRRYKTRSTARRRKPKNAGLSALSKSLSAGAWFLGGPKPKSIRKKKKWF